MLSIPQDMWSLQVFLMLVTVTSCLQPAKDEFTNQAKMRPLQRVKRRWVITTLELIEEDPGPFPKFAGELFENMDYNESLMYIISGPGVNEPPVGLFSIEDNQNGNIYVHSSIDREEIPSFVIRFDIIDISTQKVVDTSLFFTVKVGDINDNEPQFAKEEFNITVKESHSRDDPIFQVEAVDLDKEQTPNSEVSYSLVSQVPLKKGNGFYIDHSSGEIRVSGCLDYEAVQLFKLLIRANDHGEPSLSSTATVNIAVEEGNSHMPVFTKEDYKIQISEGQIQQEVLRLLVQDDDSPFTPAWKVKYKILHGNEEEHFDIVTDPGTNEGILNVIKPLDYENLPDRKLVIVIENEEPFSSCEKDQFGNGTSTATVNVKVIDTNDPPQFHPPNIIVQEVDGAGPGIQLGRYNATDPDGNSKNIRFRLVHDPARWVTVDERSGVVTTVKHVDRESPYVNNSFYTIIVNAIDDGIPPQTSTGTMMLFLSDENDNTPSLVKPFMEVCKMEQNASFLVEAEDKDLDPFSGPFTFKLDDSSGNIKDTWKLGNNFGYSVELLMVRSLPNGNYSVPFIILDKQGFFKKQMLYVKLCSCLNGITCIDSSMAFVELGGVAITLICVAFILLAVALLFLLQFSFGSANKRQPKPFPYEPGSQSLITYNDESENTSTLHYPNDTRNLHTKSQLKRKETEISEGLTGYYPNDTRNLHTKSQLKRKETEISERLTGCYPNDTRSLCTKSQMERLERKIAETLTQKLHDIDLLEYNTTYEPRTYMDEGELEITKSLSSLALTESDLPENFLDDLGSKVIALEKIYSKSVFMK
ncbi:cadherin-like protein 26 [Antechinus flavipes]|uniref:cadherin-like protein 26 n=1 Tax=Antechinus flavipes TaxID=38775 RepID=UPI0022365AAE|nr:cadherin-like protein 26 [Antechinus flavipes]